jgi:hypothetical protein
MDSFYALNVKKGLVYLMEIAKNVFIIPMIGFLVKFVPQMVKCAQNVWTAIL